METAQLNHMLKLWVYLPILVIIGILFYSQQTYFVIIGVLLLMYSVLGIINHYKDNLRHWMDLLEIIIIIVFIAFTFIQKITWLGVIITLYLCYILYNFVKNDIVIID